MSFSSKWESSKPTLVSSDLINPSSSAWYGIGRLMDLGGQLDSYNFLSTGEETDAWSLFSDWTAVGRDFRSSIEEFFEKYAQQTQAPSYDWPSQQMLPGIKAR